MSMDPSSRSREGMEEDEEQQDLRRGDGNDTNDSNRSSSLTVPLLPNQQQQRRDNRRRTRTRRRRSSTSRLLDRNGTFRQSRGRWGVERLSRFHGMSRYDRNYDDDVEDVGEIDHDTSDDDRELNDEERLNGNINGHGNATRRRRGLRHVASTGSAESILVPSSSSAAATATSTTTNNGRRNNNCCRRPTQCIRYCCPWCWWCFCRCGPIRQFAHQWGKDWFFFLAYQKTCVLFLILFTAYASIVCFFGFVYLGLSIIGSKSEINPDGSTKTIAFCDMDINDHMEAMYFSLSTMTTIGYGVSDYYFGGCYSPLLIVLWQVCTAIVFDAVAVGLIFHRISRGAKRSRTILFSDMAVVRRVNGVPHLMFRVGERRKYHLIEATVRCYIVRHTRLPIPIEGGRTTNDTLRANQRNSQKYMTPNQNMNGNDNNNGNSHSMRIETTHFVSRQMRLIHPDDQHGSHVWFGLPQVVVHRLDEDSPLVPHQPYWFDKDGRSHKSPFQSSSSSSSFNARQSETATGSKDIHGIQQLAGKGGQKEDSVVNHSIEKTHDPLADPSIETSDNQYRRQNNNLPSSSRSTHHNGNDDLVSIRSFLNDRDAEIIVLVEGTDEGTGAAIQARHSYKVCDDVAWNYTFANCVFPYSRRQRRGPSDLDPVVSIDFSKFHDIQPAPLDCPACAYVPSS